VYTYYHGGGGFFSTKMLSFGFLPHTAIACSTPDCLKSQTPIRSGPAVFLQKQMIECLDTQHMAGLSSSWKHSGLASYILPVCVSRHPGVFVCLADQCPSSEALPPSQVVDEENRILTTTQRLVSRLACYISIVLHTVTVSSIPGHAE
jgi:hypothetical protein